MLNENVFSYTKSRTRQLNVVGFFLNSLEKCVSLTDNQNFIEMLWFCSNVM